MNLLRVAIALALCLVLACAATPALALGKIEKTMYDLSGDIYGPFGDGTLSLSVSGSIPGPPYTEYAFSDMPEWGTISRSFLADTSEWTNDSGTWKMETYCDYYEEYAGVISSYYGAMWDPPLPMFRGRLDATWWDGATSKFAVQLTPYQVEKTTAHGARNVTYATETYWYMLFIWVEFDGYGFWNTVSNWSDDPVVLEPFSYSYTESWFSIYFSGMMQSKGSQPLHGTLHLSDSLWMQDGSEDRSLYVSGTFGPYSLSINP